MKTEKEILNDTINSLEHCYEYYEYDLLSGQDESNIVAAKCEGFLHAIKELKLYRNNCE